MLQWQANGLKINIHKVGAHSSHQYLSYGWIWQFADPFGMCSMRKLDVVWVHGQGLKDFIEIQDCRCRCRLILNKAL